ncbi:hypothetical protein VNI00_001201 [Paramarasmius palmivorus]|uniref:Cytochrome P450 n=1 Tax=Paramarasmius palmivorus TaxID=297713 RepID=A0AAW0E961_9AGAR
MDIFTLDKILALLGFTISLVYLLDSHRSRKPYPPGPTIDSAPRNQPWLEYRRWSKASSDSALIHFTVKGRQVVVVNEVKHAIELLEKRSKNYSNRPTFPMMDLIGRQDNVGFQPYGSQLRLSRRLIHESLRIGRWEDILDDESSTLLDGIRVSPDSYEQLLAQFIANVIVRYTYGKPADSDYLALVEETAKHSSAAMIPGKWLIDSYPFLKYLPSWLPGGSFQTWAAEAKELYRELTDKPFQEVKKQADERANCFVRDSLFSAEDGLKGSVSYSEKVIAGTAASLYSAANDTTLAMLLTAFRLLQLHPKVQDAAYTEIRSIVEHGQMPTLAQVDSLPFLNAIVKEVHRFHPPVPLMPRSPDNGDIINGLTIPRKCWMFNNLWQVRSPQRAMTHDETIYENPFSFNPWRFLGAGNLKDPRDITFGFGRRRCPGIVLANATALLVLARVISQFTLQASEEERSDDARIEFRTGFTSTHHHPQHSPQAHSRTMLYQTLTIGVLLLVAFQWYYRRRPNLETIPAVGHSSSILSYITAIRYVSESQDLISEGYRKFLQSDYTVGPGMRLYPYHAGLIRTELTRNLALLSDALFDEQALAFKELIPPSTGWRAHDIKDTFMKIVCRTSNRVFVGLPLCRDPDYIELNINFTLELVKAAIAIKAFPTPLKSLASRLFSNVRSCTRQCMKHIGPIVEARRARHKQTGIEEPNDMLMWCMNAAETLGDEKDVDKLALRMLLINFGAIHTTSLSLVWVVYNLAAHPEYVGLLREEVESIVASEGWTKAGLNKMRRVDSFVRETLRADTSGIWAMQRYALKPFTFSTGQTVPAGTMISCPVLSVQTDEALYEDGKKFKPWRFYDMRDEEEEGHKHSLPSTRPEYITFGHGKSACPGRFFAAYELKAMLAHIVTTYDIKFEDGQRKPANVYIGSACLPGDAKILFRARA